MSRRGLEQENCKLVDAVFHLFSMLIPSSSEERIFLRAAKDFGLRAAESLAARSIWQCERPRLVLRALSPFYHGDQIRVRTVRESLGDGGQRHRASRSGAKN